MYAVGNSVMAVLLDNVSLFLLWTVYMHSVSNGQDIVYHWKSLDYSWPNSTVKQQYIADKQFIVENNVISGIKVLDGNVYVTVPRWKPGVPSTLNKIITNPTNIEESILEPYPTWRMQTLGDCGALQYVQSMEVDPNTGYMWIIDVGRINIQTDQPQNICPAKLIIYDVRNDRLVHVHEFPDAVVSRTSNFMNDIVLDYVNGVATFAYITDSADAKLIVYDHNRDTSYYFKHASMEIEPGTETIVVGDNNVTTRVTIDGIAMSSDFHFVYYCALNAYWLYRVPTNVLRNTSAIFYVETVGRKIDLTGGMVFTDTALYYGGLTTNAVYKWSFGQVNNQEMILSNNTSLRWVDSLAMDDQQNLWLVANGLDLFVAGRMDFAKTHMYIWKIPMGENGYLSSAITRTKDETSSVIIG
ncbi:protein yellow-like [Mizuhopecten yessoensis]|uniref:Protein yellow n=1 Tax=Mizuhopecten yessoensis TaxID=6573 RepID=A0A210PW34_MIZYE|nr:protein yellow-like [Mizuhopecten yessoensis]OWF40693.1 Protein yellow [Mizuhopecten yessoensis]